MTEKWNEVPTPILLDDHSARHEDGGADEISLTGLEGTGIRFTPITKPAVGAEGTLFYCSDANDKYVYVATSH